MRGKSTMLKRFLRKKKTSRMGTEEKSGELSSQLAFSHPDDCLDPENEHFDTVRLG